jgi:hypothetical protein
MNSLGIANVAVFAMLVLSQSAHAEFVSGAGGNEALSHAGESLRTGVFKSTLADAKQPVIPSVSRLASGCAYLYELTPTGTTANMAPPSIANLRRYADERIGKQPGILNKSFRMDYTGDAVPVDGVITGNFPVGLNLYSALYTSSNRAGMRPRAAHFLASTYGSQFGGTAIAEEAQTETLAGAVPVPLPGAVALFVMGLPGLLFLRRHRRKLK